MSASAACAWIAAAFAVLPLALTLANLRRGSLGFEQPTADAPAGSAVSILIPARDEEARIGTAVTAALASRGVRVEVVVLDDQSSDATAAVVEALAASDSRVRLLRAGRLPAGWAGKQRACARLAGVAQHPVLMFIDADVRLAPDAASRACAFLLADRRRAAPRRGPSTPRPAHAPLGLVSGFPAEHTGSLGECLVVPWIHVLLLGYLPMARMRRNARASFGAGCGQWMVARRDAYEASGGHAAAPLSRHDGLSLPRSFRAAGWHTDLFDGSRLASCRMYRGFAQTWHGFGKSAGEGMATVSGLPVWTVLLLLGHVAPWLFLLRAAAAPADALLAPALVGVTANLLQRALLAARLGQPLLGMALHPIGALTLLAIQWQALLRHVRGAPSRWKGRSYPPIEA